MSKLIHYPIGQDPQILESDWRVWQPEEAVMPIPSGRQIIPFWYWKSHSDDPNLLKRALLGEFGVWFSEGDDVLKSSQLIHAGKKLWPLVAIHFSIFRDGRGYSAAALLRDRLAWQGPIWAIGDVLIDQLNPLSRVGFDHFLLRADQDSKLALAQFSQFNVFMQSSWRSPRSKTIENKAAGL